MAFLYLDAVIPGFGLEAEAPLLVGVDRASGGLVLPQVGEGHPVAALLLQALRQAAHGNLATHAEPGTGVIKSSSESFLSSRASFLQQRNLFT